MALIPLLAGFQAGAPIGWRADGPVSWEHFLAAARAFADRLPRGGYCVNLCDDRLNFMLAFAAALLARCTSLLPQSRAPDALRELARSHRDAIYLADEGAPSPGDVLRVEEAVWSARGAADVPSIPGDQQAAILFTSGSTGVPQAHAKSWRSLAAASQAARHRLQLSAGTSLLVAVPPQHMWGFETSVMLPMQAGCAVHSACPLLPGEIFAALEQLPSPRWLVATPLHLRACISAGATPPALNGVLCATAALPMELAAAVEKSWRVPLFEIYGSTETGAMASRRPAQSESFETVGGIRLRTDKGTTLASEGQLDAPVALNDLLELKSDTVFVLRGRAADLVKIGGKRASLAALTLELGRAPGVVDCAYLPREPGRGEPRLCAFAVARGATVAEILDYLRQRVDPVFLPRPLVLVDALPRNRAGKLSWESVVELAARHGLAPAASAGALWQHVEPSHPALPFHFPGNPIVPGVWLLALVEEAVRERYGSAILVQGIPDASFRNVLRPGERFRIELERIAADRIAFRVVSEIVRIADGTLTVQGAA
jgi:acyl-coenzyme A synthetase/AMP-(fatty) acid ligase/3-hydroxymyristoyl/3-hydroxydecanoyl-(acyl carrier protein) dehydratase